MTYEFVTTGKVGGGFPRARREGSRSREFPLSPLTQQKILQKKILRIAPQDYSSFHGFTNIANIPIAIANPNITVIRIVLINGYRHQMAPK